MSSGKTTILLVDDEDLVRGVIRRMLVLAGYTVLEAPSADQALAISREHDGAIQLLISDIQMPGMSGIEFAAQLERERPGIRILLISGYAGKHGSRIKHPILDKPFTMNDLLLKVAEVLENEGES